MIRGLALLGSGLLAASLAGCGSSGGGTPANPDMATGVGGSADLTMTVGGNKDLLMPNTGGTAQTGEPCAKAADCANSVAGSMVKATCVTKSMLNGKSIAWTDGYCESPCRPKNTNPDTGINTDCPSDNATCAPTSQTQGVCFAACASVTDCRDAYVCALTSGTRAPICVPTAESGCDPKDDPRPQMLKCKMGQTCVNYSPDNSYGGCADICKPPEQGCAPLMQGNVGCVADLNSLDGSGDCIGVNGGLEGGACFYLNDCAAGLQCYARTCRQYCRQIGNNPETPKCPQGQKCVDMTFSGLTIAFKKDTTGICSP